MKFREAKSSLCANARVFSRNIYPYTAFIAEISLRTCEGSKGKARKITRRSFGIVALQEEGEFFTWGRCSYCEHSRVNPAEVYETASLERSTYFIVGVALYRAIFSARSVYLLAGRKPSLEYPINVYDLINALSPRCLTAHLPSDRAHARTRFRLGAAL